MGGEPAEAYGDGTMIIDILAGLGAAVIILAVIIGICAWLMSGLKPGDLP